MCACVLMRAFWVFTRGFYYHKFNYELLQLYTPRMINGHSHIMADCFETSLLWCSSSSSSSSLSLLTIKVILNVQRSNGSIEILKIDFLLRLFWIFFVVVVLRTISCRCLVESCDHICAHPQGKNSIKYPQNWTVKNDLHNYSH